MKGKPEGDEIERGGPQDDEMRFGRKMGRKKGKRKKHSRFMKGRK
jgi:hypothetical protein